MTRALTLAAVLLTLATASSAGPPIRTVSHPGGGPTVSIGGVALSCPTPAGGLVWWMVTYPGSGPVGLNSSRGGVSWTLAPEPHIFLRADVFGALAPQVQLYIALHECAHFTLSPQMNTELNADCWAVRTALANRWLSASDLDFVRKQMESGAVAQWGHPGTLIHYQNIEKCLAGG